MDQKNYYEKFWGNGGQHISEYMIFKQNIIRDIDNKESLVFDYGGGNGQAVEFIKNKNNVIIGDISEKALNSASIKGFDTAIINDDFDFGSLNKYQYVLLLDCLEHMIDPEQTFKNIVENIKSGTYLYISVPNMSNIYTRIFFLFGKYIDFCDKNHLTDELFSEHIQLFSKEKLEKLANKYHLRILKKNYYMPRNIEFSKNIVLANFWNILYLLKFQNLFPSLFSMCFFYICKKD